MFCVFRKYRRENVVTFPVIVPKSFKKFILLKIFNLFICYFSQGKKKKIKSSILGPSGFCFWSCYSSPSLTRRSLKIACRSVMVTLLFPFFHSFLLKYSPLDSFIFLEAGRKQVKKNNKCNEWENLQQTHTITFQHGQTMPWPGTLLYSEVTTLKPSSETETFHSSPSHFSTYVVGV